MPKSEPTQEELKQRTERALEWASFRLQYNFTQKMLAQTLTAIDTDKTGRRRGVSRRTIQQIEGRAMAKPHDRTLALFAELKKRYAQNKGK